MLQLSRNILVRCSNMHVRYTPAVNLARNFSLTMVPHKQDLLQNKETLSGAKKLLQRFKGSASGVYESINPLQLKKRPLKKRRMDDTAPGYYVTAYATAEEYDLERLAKSLRKQDLYEQQKFFPDVDHDEEPKDVIHFKPKYQVENEPRDIYFFREGTVVLWNCTDLEISNILSYLRLFEIDRYDEHVVHDELEQMHYCYADNESTHAHLKGNQFYLSKEGSATQALEKYTYSNAMSLTTKLGIWEASLDKYIDSMEFVTEDLKRGRPITISRPNMLRKTGELFALRHLINLSSDLLDTPDFYWDREQLESLYSQTCNYFSIPKRTRVMNEKINHCVELASLINSHLNDNHHVRLEWMIIILIMVEVGFEVLHFVDRFIT